VALLALIGLLLIYPLEEGAATHVLDAGELSRASPPTCL
jgi:hypothetical protein